MSRTQALLCDIFMQEVGFCVHATLWTEKVLQSFIGFIGKLHWWHKVGNTIVRDGAGHLR